MFSNYESLKKQIKNIKREAKKHKNNINRNIVAQEALTKAIKSKPAPLFKNEYASRIKVGNFEDDFEKIRNADWILEVVVEQLDVKQNIFEKVEKYRDSRPVLRDSMNRD